MYSGNIALTQGLDTVVAAAACLRHIPDITFVIAGEAIALVIASSQYLDISK
ncbi:hypothetical protein NSMS1_54620 [Nostoc sp. MS1]|nr:hypothetical protein NSMS1_54620 [Nostoc sp. MS1]